MSIDDDIDHDRVDHDTNGLTDDQQERIDTALQDLQLAAALVSA